MRAKIIFALWFSSLATLIIIGLLVIINFVAALGVGGGLSALVLFFPTCAILFFFCVPGVAALYYLRPKLLKISRKTVLTTALGYLLLLTAFFSYPPLRGGYTFELTVVDWQKKPIPGVPVSFLRQNSSSTNLLLLPLMEDDVQTATTTDAHGRVSVRTNRFQTLSAIVNAARSRWEYRFAELRVEPKDHGRTTVDISWDNRNEQDGSNMHRVRSDNQLTPVSAVTLFLPTAAGDDADPYSSEPEETRFRQAHVPDAASVDVLANVSVTKADRSISVGKDGRPTEINLSKGEETPLGTGDLRVEAWTHDEGHAPNSHDPYDWHCRISAINGVLTSHPVENDLAYKPEWLAPSDEIAMPASTGRLWRDTATRTYFVRYTDGRYAIVEFTMIAGGDHFFVVKSYLVPADRTPAR